MVDPFRPILDQLMGPTRDSSVYAPPETRSFWEPCFCKAYYFGVCEHELFSHTKVDPGPCPLIHNPQMKSEFLSCPVRWKYGYEREVLRRAKDLVNGCDKHIRGKRRNISLTNEGVSGNDNEDILERSIKETKELYSEMSEELRMLNDKAENNIEEAFDILAEDKDGIRSKAIHLWSIDRILCAGQTRESPNPDASFGAFSTQMLRVCDVCGGLLSSLDTPEKLTSHMSGKLHQGYLKLRQFIEEQERARR